MAGLESVSLTGVAQTRVEVQADTQSINTEVNKSTAGVSETPTTLKSAEETNTENKTDDAAKKGCCDKIKDALSRVFAGIKSVLERIFYCFSKKENTDPAQKSGTEEGTKRV